MKKEAFFEAERDVQKKTVSCARRLKWLAYKFSAPGRRGVPDYIFMRKVDPAAYEVLFIEFKATGKKPSGLQWLCIKAIRLCGVEVLVIDSSEEGKAQFKDRQLFSVPGTKKIEDQNDNDKHNNKSKEVLDVR